MEITCKSGISWSAVKVGICVSMIVLDCGVSEGVADVWVHEVIKTRHNKIKKVRLIVTSFIG